MQKFVKDFLKLLNDYRADPQMAKPLLEKYKSYIDAKNIMRIPGSNCGIQLSPQGLQSYEVNAIFPNYAFYFILGCP